MKDITSTTGSEEKSREKLETNSHTSLSYQRKPSKYYIALQRGEWIFNRFGFTIQLDLMPNGDCQFEAVANQLETIGIYRSADTLRQDVVRDLQRNPELPNGTSLQCFIGHNNLKAFLLSMSNPDCCDRLIDDVIIL